MRRSRDRRVFAKTAKQTKKINTAVSMYRGGIRL